MMQALMTNKKSPKVSMVIGSVRITMIGLTMKLSKLNAIATIMAVTYPSTDTWGRIYDKTTTATALRSNLMMKFIEVFILG